MWHSLNGYLRQRRPARRAIALMLVSAIVSGCSRSSDEAGDVQNTATVQRAARRAYDGAPPVIPHESMKANCITCHTVQGEKVPNMGFAAANPHDATSVAGRTQNCRQCHLFRKTEEVFTASNFEGIPHTIIGGSRAYPGAPPMIPHSKLMRENCQACHSGPAARKEIVCTHTTRTNCQQCHLFRVTGELFGKL